MYRGVKIAQQSRYDCGAAALCSLATQHGLCISLAKARMLCGCTREGITIKGIIEAGKKLGFNCSGFKSADKDHSSLIGIPLPAIAHTVTKDGFYHYITILEIKGDSLTVMDPDGGEIKRLSTLEFSQLWTGYIVLAEPSESFAPKDERGSTYRMLLEISLQHKKELIHTVSGAIMLFLIGMCNSIFLQRIIDVAIPQRDAVTLTGIASATAILAVLALFISYKKQIYLSVHGIKITSHLIKRYLKKIVFLGQPFYSQYQAGDISSRVSDAFNIRILLSEGVVSIIVSFAALCVSIPILYHYNTPLALMCTAFVPLFIITNSIAGPKNARYSKDLAQAGAKFEATLLQTIEGNTTTRHHCAEKWVLKRLETSFDTHAQCLYKVSKASAVLGISTEGLSKGIITSILVSGGFAVFNNNITVGELVSFYTLCPLFCVPLANLVNMNPVIKQAKVSAERLFEIMDLEYEEHRVTQSSGGDNETKDIDIRGLSFGYPGSIVLLKDINITIKQGKIILFDGAVGTGKSTFASLLMQDMAVEAGKIFYGGRDITSIPVREWRKIISIAPQKCHIYSASILENIVLDDEDPDIGRVTAICTKLGILGKIASLPSSLHTVIGENGVALSGGEMQKIAIARVLYRGTDIMIFDESTSSMDAGSEQVIMEIMKHLREDGTTIITISHNERFKEIADYIVGFP